MPGVLWQDETKLKAWYLILRKWDIHTESLPEGLETNYLLLLFSC